MKLLLDYFKSYKLLIAFALLSGAISQVFFLLDTHFLGIIIDQYAAHPHSRSQSEYLTGVAKYLGIIIGVALISRMARVLQDYLVAVIVQKLGMRLYTDGLMRSLALPYEEFEDQRSGETLKILQNAKDDTRDFIHSSIYILFSILVSIIYVAIYSFTVHWSLIIFYLVAGFLLLSLALVLTGKIKVSHQVIAAENVSLAGSTTESLRSLELIRSLGLSDQEGKRVSNKVYKILELKLKQLRSVRAFSFIQGGLIYFLCALIFVILLLLVYQHALSTGKLITVLFYSYYIFAPFRETGNAILSFRIAQVSMNNLHDLLQKKPEPSPVKPVDVGQLNKLAFIHVYYRHKTSKYNALDNVSFEAKRGQTIAFVGPSGSGKTTLVKLLVGLYHPKAGEVRYNEVSWRDIHFDGLRTQVGLVTQDTQLFAGTIKENLLFVHPGATDDELLHVLKIAALEQVLARSAKGMDTMIGEGGVKLSGGEKQRLSIARALLRKPALMIFDEATSSLDTISEAQVTSTIRAVSAQQQPITIMIAHRLSTIMHADEIYVLEKGRVVEKGVHEDLLARKGLYYAMWRQQIGER